VAEDKNKSEKHFDLFISKDIGTVTVYSKQNYTDEELQIFDALLNVISAIIAIRRESRQLGCMLVDSIAETLRNYYEFYQLLKGGKGGGTKI